MLLDAAQTAKSEFVLRHTCVRVWFAKRVRKACTLLSPHAPKAAVVCVMPRPDPNLDSSPALPVVSRLFPPFLLHHINPSTGPAYLTKSVMDLYEK